MKILLINPQRILKNPHNQYTSIPIGLISLASFLQINGHEVEILDTIGEDLKHCEKLNNNVYRCGMSNDKVYKCIEKFTPDVVGISCSFTPRFSNVIKIADLVKQYNSKVPVIVGGMHATVCADKVLQEPTIDFVVMGEAEFPTMNLLEKLKGEWKPEELKALSYRTKEGIFISSERVLLDTLDVLPLPAYDLIPMEKYFKSGIKRDSLTEETRQVSIVTSRGCPFNCTFCSSQSLWGNTCRMRSPMHILSEIEMLLNIYQVKEIAFEDDNLTINKDRIHQLCREIIHRNLHFKWTTPNGVHLNTLDLSLIRLMKSSGCRRLNFGIESGDENILKIMNKNLDLTKVKNILKMCSDEGIVTLGYFVLGMPGETEETLKKTIDYAKSLPLNEIGLFIATPFPSTQLEKECKEKGYLKKDFTEIIAEDDIENQIFFETPILPTKKLLYYKNLFLKEFYNKKIFEKPFYYAKRLLKNPKIIRKLWQE